MFPAITIHRRMSGSRSAWRGAQEQSEERRARSTERRARAQSAEPIAESGEKKPYRSKIMRGSMKNYFPRNRERVQKQSMIRFIVILIILVFVIYIYLRY